MNNMCMNTFERPRAIEEIVQRNKDIEEKYTQDRFRLSMGAAEYIVEEHGGITRDIDLYAVAMYALHGPTSEVEEWLKSITDSLNTARGGDVMASTDRNGGIAGAYRIPKRLPKSGLWNFKVELCYVNQENNLGAYVGDLMLDKTVELGSGSFRTLSKKWLNHGYEHNYEEHYCEGVVVGLPAILDGGISLSDAQKLKGFV